MYKLIFPNSFKKSINNIDKQYHNSILNQIKNIQSDPFRHLEKTKNPNLPSYKTRKGEYRILLDIDENLKTIKIYKVSHRKDIYDLK